MASAITKKRIPFNVSLQKCKSFLLQSFVQMQVDTAFHSVTTSVSIAQKDTWSLALEVKLIIEIIFKEK